MKRKKRSTGFGAALVIFGIAAGVALGARLIDPDTPDRPLLRLPQGGFLRPAETIVGTTQNVVQAGPAQPVRVTFTASDASKILLQYGSDCHYRPDVKALLLSPLEWELSAEAPTVLILHTHGSESYTKQPGQDYAQSGEYRTLDTDFNMVGLGDLLAQKLEAAGIRVLHDRQIHDYPSYNSSYTNARQSAQAYLRQYPTIQVVLDLHRDAVLNSDGTQYAPTVTVNGQKVARLMLVVGTDASGMHHPRWRGNLAAAVKLQVLLERQAPGITRPVLLRAQRFNHDLSTGAMIVEIGAAGNTLEEATRAVEYLAQSLIRMMHGTVTENSTS